MPPCKFGFASFFGMRRHLLPKWTLCLLALLPAALMAVPAGHPDDIAKRLTSPAKLCLIGEPCVTTGSVVSSLTAPKSPADTYGTFCFACHATGVSDSPILGDSAVWRPRIAKGIDALYDSSINGMGLMPARGTCITCSDDELRAVVDYMVEQSQ